MKISRILPFFLEIVSASIVAKEDEKLSENPESSPRRRSSSMPAPKLKTKSSKRGTKIRELKLVTKEQEQPFTSPRKSPKKWENPSPESTSNLVSSAPQPAFDKIKFGLNLPTLPVLPPSLEPKRKPPSIPRLQISIFSSSYDLQQASPVPRGQADSVAKASTSLSQLHKLSSLPISSNMDSPTTSIVPRFNPDIPTPHKLPPFSFEKEPASARPHSLASPNNSVVTRISSLDIIEQKCRRVCSDESSESQTKRSNSPFPPFAIPKSPSLDPDIYFAANIAPKIDGILRHEASITGNIPPKIKSFKGPRTNVSHPDTPLDTSRLSDFDAPSPPGPLIQISPSIESHRKAPQVHEGLEETFCKPSPTKLFFHPKNRKPMQVINELPSCEIIPNVHLEQKMSKDLARVHKTISGTRLFGVYNSKLEVASYSSQDEQSVIYSSVSEDDVFEEILTFESVGFREWKKKNETPEHDDSLEEDIFDRLEAQVLQTIWNRDEE